MLLGILVGKIYWDSSSPALLWADCLFSQGERARSALQRKHRFPALVCLASGLFDRLHVLLNISSDAHFQSAVNVSLGCCLKIRSLKISSFNKKILLPEGPASNMLRPTVRAVDLWQSWKSTGIPAHWLQGSTRWAASTGRIQNGQLLSFFLLSKMNEYFKSTCQPQPELSGCCQDSYTSLIICFVASIGDTHTYTHTLMYAYGITTATFWKKPLKLFFLGSCVEIS